MDSRTATHPSCIGAGRFHPDAFVQDETRWEATLAFLRGDDLQGAVQTWFGIRADGPDEYVYHAHMSVTLADVQGLVRKGGGLWCYGRELQSPTRADVEAYIAVFLPRKHPLTALRDFGANAKKGSVRRRVADYLMSQWFVLEGHPLREQMLDVPRGGVGGRRKRRTRKGRGKGKGGGGGAEGEVGGEGERGNEREDGKTNGNGPEDEQSNGGDDSPKGDQSIQPTITTVLTTPHAPTTYPYLIFWAWSSLHLLWCGPLPLAPIPSDSTPRHRPSHPILPILMHHFGCAVPTPLTLHILKILADGRPIADLGSGNGHWSWALRSLGLTVHPIDSLQSAWRTTWVPDTLARDAATWVSKSGGCKQVVLLLVYPIVGGGIAGGRPGGFVRGIMDAYAGDTVAVVGTQNANGYTGFGDMTMGEYMEREKAGDWIKVVQMPVPSFAGKDDALWVFQRRKVAGRRVRRN